MTSEQTPTPPGKPNQAAGCGCLALLLAVVFGGVAFCVNKSTTPDQKQTACEDRTMAYVMAQDFVSARLKAPATANFPAIASGEPTVLPIAGCKFIVSSYVDSQNSFGANVRSQFVATLAAPVTGDSWRLESLDMAQQ